MAGEGHIQAMINSLKNNKAMLGNRNSLRDVYEKSSTTKLEFKKVSDETLNELRKNIRKKAKKDQQRMTIIYIVITLLVMLLFYYLFNGLSIFKF